MLLEERRVPLERDAALGFAEKQEELLSAIVQRVEYPIQFAGAELFGARDRRDVAHQFLELIAADAHAEILARDVFDLVRFVENYRGVFRNDAAEVVVLHRQVREEQMVIDDDDVALVRAAVHFGEKAALELLALLAGAEFAAGVHLQPGGTGLGQRFDLGAIASSGGLLPFANNLKVGDFFQAVENGFAVGVVDLLTAREVSAAFHVADLQGPIEMFLQERDVFVKKLLLQILGAGGNDDALAREQRRHQIRKRFPGA